MKSDKVQEVVSGSVRKYTYLPFYLKLDERIDSTHKYEAAAI